MSLDCRRFGGLSVWRIGLVVAVLALGCNTEPCACPPAASSLVFYGQVLTVTGQPIEGAAITVTLAPPTCAFPVTGPPSATATTRPDGRFRTTSELGAAGTEACTRIAAASGGGGQPIATTEGVLVRFPRQPNGIDSVGFVLRAQQ